MKGSATRTAEVEHNMNAEDLLILAGNEAYAELRESTGEDDPLPLELSLTVEVEVDE